MYDFLEFFSRGEDVQIHETSILKRTKYMTIGNHVDIGPFCYISSKLITKDYVHISSHVSIIGGEKSKCILDNFSFLSAGSRLICLSDDFTQGLVGPFFDESLKVMKGGEIHLKDFAGVGTNAVIMPGITMAEGSILGANSLLTKDTEPWTIYVGNPAKPVKVRNKDLVIQKAKEIGYDI